MPTVTLLNSNFSDTRVLDHHGPTLLRRHASCPPGALRQFHLESDPTRRLPASATRSLLITRDDQGRTPSATTTYSASVSSPINPENPSWAHVSVTTQAQWELGSKAKDVRVALETGSFAAVYPLGLGNSCQMEIEQNSPLNAWTDPLVYGRYDDEHYYDDGYHHEHSSPIHMHTCHLFDSPGAHTPSLLSLSCPACNDSMQGASTDSALENYLSQGLISVSLGMDGVHSKDNNRVSPTWDWTLDTRTDRI